MEDPINIGDIWANHNKTVVFIVLDKITDGQGWKVAIQFNGETKIHDAYFDRNLTNIKDTFWRIA